MTWNEGEESEMGGQGEINFEKIWQKRIGKKEKEDVIGICSHKACQEMTEDADLSALGQIMKHQLWTVLMND